jgi:hypothetical protein
MWTLAFLHSAGHILGHLIIFSDLLNVCPPQETVHIMRSGPLSAYCTAQHSVRVFPILVLMNK